MKTQIDPIRLWNQTRRTAGAHGSYSKARTMKIRSFPHRKPPSLVLWWVTPTADMAYRVSVSNPCSLDRGSCEFRCLFAPEENAVGAVEGENGSSGPSRRTSECHSDVDLLLTCTSCEKRLEGYCSWRCRYPLRRRNGGRRCVHPSQGYPGRHLRHLHELQCLPTIVCFKRSPDVPCTGNNRC